ncbi:hypothetical protein AJ80_01418 [Polytolypa hystricis UAMH7299]|uniref:Fungal N-terminal domain-containing protein n=1 Tax=Polytolypa hystricis (strain UAMH7299) TaxID=1447883 RepID=A0A2B7Z129_POLH7|nr:hypothetical protein AJ80_01418 [Polytolypa hystricis UAMH7299]
MDPLSVAASIAGLLALSGKLCSILDSIIRDVRDVPSNLSWTLSQLKETNLALTALDTLIENLTSAPKRRRALIGRRVLAFEELDKLITPFARSSGDIVSAWDRMRWLRNADSITRAIERLGYHKASLPLVLGIIQCSSESAAHTLAEELSQNVSQIVEQNCGLQQQLERLEDLYNRDAVIEDDSVTVRGATQSDESSRGPSKNPPGRRIPDISVGV